MASIVVAGDTSGTVTLTAPLVAGTTTLTLPTANGTLITTGSSGQSIPRAALPTGSVLQVVSQQGVPLAITSTSTSVNLLTQSFTPTSATSKVLALMSFTVERQGGSGANYIFINLARNGTNIVTPYSWGNAPGYQANNGDRGVGFHVYLDSPATTSAISYTFPANFVFSGGVQWEFYTLQLTLMEIAA